MEMRGQPDRHSCWREYGVCGQETYLKMYVDWLLKHQNTKRNEIEERERETEREKEKEREKEREREREREREGERERGEREINEAQNTVLLID